MRAAGSATAATAKWLTNLPPPVRPPPGPTNVTDLQVVRLRLARFGRKHAPTYRIVAADARCPRDGKHIEQVGSYDPKPRKDGTKEIRLKADRIKCVQSEARSASCLRDVDMRPPPLPPSPSRAHRRRPSSSPPTTHLSNHPHRRPHRHPARPPPNRSTLRPTDFPTPLTDRRTLSPRTQGTGSRWAPSRPTGCSGFLAWRRCYRHHPRAQT